MADLFEDEPLAVEFRGAVTGLFEITHAIRKDILGSHYVALHAKPSKRIREALFLDRELLVLIADFVDVQARTIQAVGQIIAGASPRLFPTYAIVVHSDSKGGASLKKWGREQNISILPIYRPPSGLPSATELERILSRDLHSIDPFDVSVAVVDDRDFYGRREEALALARQLEAGQVRSLFAIRKVGKTSILDRVVKIARETETFASTVGDCSKEFLWKEDAASVLSMIKAGLAAAARSPDGYATLDQSVVWGQQSDVALFAELRAAKRSVVLFLDEIDYVTPSSPTNPERWRGDFNVLWRELRAFWQEAHRQGCRLGLLACGVSSKWFRMETVNGVENAALTFVPESYLAPFPRGASEPMLRDLGKRCGLRLADSAVRLIADTCGDFPFWMRKAGSFLHRHVPPDHRPVDLEADQIGPLIDEFVAGEGAALAATSLRHFLRQIPEMVAPLNALLSQPPASVEQEQLRFLGRYGLVAPRAVGKIPELCPLIREALLLVRDESNLLRSDDAAAGGSESTRAALRLDETEWAEELSVIGRRRNILERRLRETVVTMLHANALGRPGAKSAHVAVLESLSSDRRKVLETLDTRSLAEKLFLKELAAVVERSWTVFEQLFGDKVRFMEVVGVVNIRPDTHAKDADLADIARQREALSWLEDKLRF